MFSRHVQLVGDLGVDAAPAGENISHLLWKRLEIRQEELKNVAADTQTTSLRLLPLQPGTISIRKWIDGWTFSIKAKLG